MTSSVPKKTLFVMERVTVSGLVSLFLLCRSHSGGYVMETGGLMSSPFFRRWLRRLTGLRPFYFRTIRGAYYKAQLSAARSTVEGEWKGNAFVRRTFNYLNHLRPHPLMDLVLRRVVAERQVYWRAKSLLAIKFLTRRHPRITFLSASQDLLLGDLEQEAASLPPGVTTPRVYLIGSAIEARVRPLASLLFLIGLILRLVLRRGIQWTFVPPIRWGVGFDIFSNGIHWEKPYHDTFLYNKDVLAPQRILHIVRGKLTDKKTREYYAQEKIPNVNSGRIEIPWRYAFQRLLWDIGIGYFQLCFQSIWSGDEAGSLWLTAQLAGHLLPQVEILDLAHPVDVFVGRDEYGPTHILRRIVFDGRGAKTIGFLHGQCIYRELVVSCLSPHILCVQGEISRNLLKDDTRHCDRISVIGAGVYGLDETFNRIQSMSSPPSVSHAKRRRRVGVFGTSYGKDIFVTESGMLRFYRTVMETLQPFPDLEVILRPKGNETDTPAFRRLFTRFERHVFIDKETWTYDLLPSLDLILCIGFSAVGFEALMSGRPVLFFDETGCNDPLRQHSPLLVATTPEEFRQNVSHFLREGQYVEENILRTIREKQGLKFDGNVVSRLRQEVGEALYSVRHRNSIKS